jgi:hypothetical protein
MSCTRRHWPPGAVTWTRTADCVAETVLVSMDGCIASRLTVSRAAEVVGCGPGGCLQRSRTTAHACPGRRPPAAMAAVMHASVWSCGTQTSMWIRLRWGAARPSAGTRTMAAAAWVDQVLSGCRRDRGSQHGTPERHHLEGRRARRSLPALCTADVSAGTPSSRATSKICGPARCRAPVASRTLPSSGDVVRGRAGSSTDRGRGGQAGGSARRTRRRRPGRRG